jgi:PAS domain S-box-containing protein
MSTTPKILVVDDEPLMCDSLKQLLSGQGYEVHTATSGKEAQDILSKRQFDLALLDMIMPDTDGHQLMDHVNSLDADTLVIFVTGHASVDSAIGALKRGAYDYIQKPFEYDEMTNTIKNALNQKRLKRENETINRKLRLSEERYRSLVQNSPDIIYTLDHNGRFTFINNAVYAILGYDSNQLIGNHYAAIIYEDDVEKAKWAFNERRTGERATSGVELRLKFSDENEKFKSSELKYKTIELKSSGMYDNPADELVKRYLGTHGVARDISNRKRLEDKLQHAQKIEAIGTLAGGIAHDFNNLLMGVQGYTSIILLETDVDHPHYEKLRNVEQYVQRGAELTKQLLGFARGGKYDVKPVDLNELVHKASQMFGRTKKEIVIHEKYGKDILPVEADPGQIEQVLLNLFLNASNAMPNGGDLTLESENVTLDAPAVSPFGLQPGPYVKISVTDNGVGMDEETLQRIFEPFFTTKEMGHGTGLGLASAYGIIKNHNGIIDVDSKKGEGTTFRFYLPASKKEVRKGKHESVQMLKGPETVLLVDDENLIIEVGVEVLKALGYKVVIAKSGKEAVDIYKSGRDKIDLIVLDMIMPGMGGGETYDALKKIDPDVKVLLSSGYSIDGMAKDILKRGCNQFIQKPFNIKEFSQKLREVLDQKGV